MKTLLYCLIFLGYIPSIYAQNTAKNKDAGVYYSQNLIQIPSDIGLKFIVKENSSGSFSENPVIFLEKNFDIETYISTTKNKDYHGYKVSFKSDKVHLLAEFSSTGELLYTFRRFENKKLPFAIQKEVAKNYKDWRIIKNSYIASGQKDRVDNEVYRINLYNGRKSQVIRITPKPESGDAFANN